jgi:hypothetical protein
MRSGLKILEDLPGSGPLIERHGFYRIRIKKWLNRGEALRWDSPWGLIDHAVLDDDGHTSYGSASGSSVFPTGKYGHPPNNTATRTKENPNRASLMRR